MSNNMNLIADRIKQLEHALAAFPNADLLHGTTPLQKLTNLGDDLSTTIYAKRDDRTDLAFGGNKIRQLEYYFGEALKKKADTILITGAVQSNFVRSAATVARQYKMDCHIQLEQRVADQPSLYHTNGNVLLDKILGATLHSFPDGEDEAGADAQMHHIAEQLRQQGKRPYIIHLGADSSPIGALGYVKAAIELQSQLDSMESIDEIFVPSGSALTHAGLLYGLRALGLNIRVRGVCVRRDAVAQMPRLQQRVEDISNLLGLSVRFVESDFQVFDDSLAPGYGKVNVRTISAMTRAAQQEGLFLDPVYSGKTMSSLVLAAQSGELKNKRVLFWHTGGLPALFAYADQLVTE